MFCPQCKAEYRPGFTRCGDCDVDLVEQLPQEAIEPRQSAESAAPGDPNANPFCSFWKGEDPRVHAELCSVLDEAGIPHNSVFRRDHLFNLRNYPAFELGVPFSMYERAENAVKEAYGTDDVNDVGAQEVQLLPDRPFKPIRSLPATVTPTESTDENDIPGPPNPGQDMDWFPEDATVRVWSTKTGDRSDFLLAALHENGIHCRLDRNGRHAELYVLSEDEVRAREIVREVVEGRPPE